MDFRQNWYIGSQPAFDVHVPNAGASLIELPASRIVAELPAEQLVTSSPGAGHDCEGGGKLAALHVVTGEPPPPHVRNPEPHAHSPWGNMQQIPRVAMDVEAPG